MVCGCLICGVSCLLIDCVFRLFVFDYCFIGVLLVFGFCVGNSVAY